MKFAVVSAVWPQNFHVLKKAAKLDDAKLSRGCEILYARGFYKCLRNNSEFGLIRAKKFNDTRAACQWQ